MVALHPFNWHSWEAILGSWYPVSLWHWLITCSPRIFLYTMCVILMDVKGPYMRWSFLCLHPTLVGPGKERPPNEAISCNARHLARPFWSLSNASWISKKAWRKEWKATKCEWTIAFFSAISILGLNLDSAKYSISTYFNHISHFGRWHPFSNAKSEVHKSHMAAVGTVAIPHEAGAFALASLAVPGVVKPQWCICQRHHIKSNDKRILSVQAPKEDTPHVVLAGLLFAIVEGIGSNPQEASIFRQLELQEAPHWRSHHIRLSMPRINE